jgi:hypothetical protein
VLVKKNGMKCRNLRLFRKFNNFRPKPYFS